MRCVAVALIVALSGCASNSDVYFRTPEATRSVPAAGGMNAGGSVEMRSPATSAAFALLLFTFGSAAVAAGSIVPHLEIPGMAFEPTPDPTRRVSVQDCTKPIDPDSGNLRCR